MPVTPVQDLIPMLRTVSSHEDDKSKAKFPELVTRTQPRTRRTNGQALPPDTILPLRPEDRRWYVAQLKSNRDRMFVRELHAIASKAKTTSRPITTLCLLDPDPAVQVKSGNSLFPGQRILLPGIVFLFFAQSSPWYHAVRDSRHLFQLNQVKDQIELHRSLQQLYRKYDELHRRLKQDLKRERNGQVSERTLEGLRQFRTGLDAWITPPSKLAGLCVKIVKTHEPTDEFPKGSVIVQIPVGTFGAIEHELPPDMVTFTTPATPDN